MIQARFQANQGKRQHNAPGIELIIVEVEGRAKRGALQLVNCFINRLEAGRVRCAEIASARGLGNIRQRLLVNIDLDGTINSIAKQIAGRIGRHAAGARPYGVHFDAQSVGRVRRGQWRDPAPHCSVHR